MASRVGSESLVFDFSPLQPSKDSARYVHIAQNSDPDGRSDGAKIARSASVSVMDTGVIDGVDRAILDLLVQDGRRTVTDIAERVSMSVSPVKRRIDRLERLGVIVGYTAIVDRSKLESVFEAFVELRFSGDTDVGTITMAASRVPEVLEVFTVAGDPDALVRLHATGVEHLREIINELRRSGQVIGTKTLMVLGTWRRAMHAQD